MKHQKFYHKNNTIDLYRIRESEVIFSSLKNLDDEGTAVFLVNKNFLLQRDRRDIYDFIKKIGFSLEAIFHIPKGGFKPLTTIETRMLVIKKGSLLYIFLKENYLSILKEIKL